MKTSRPKVQSLYPRSTQDDAHAFKPMLVEIEEEPASPLGHLIFWLVLAVFGFFVVWSIFGQVDVVVSARGKVVPVGEIKTIQPLNGGVISQILVKPGDYVKKGQALVVIDPSTTAPSLQANQRTLAHVQQEEARLQATSVHHAFDTKADATQRRLYAAAMQSLTRQVASKQQQLETLAAQIRAKQVEVKQNQDLLTFHQEKLNRLAAVSDIVTRDDIQKAENDVLTDQNKLKELAFGLEQLHFQQEQTREEMGYIQENFKSGALNDLSEKEKQVNQLEANIEEADFKNARQTLNSPVDGYVNEMAVHTVGGVVTSAQKLMTVVPVDTPLQVEATVENKDIGFIQLGMPVNLKIDTYDFQKYGTLPGKVTHIDRDSKEDPRQGPVYTIAVTPLKQELKVNGRWQRISSGLSLSAEVKTGKRRIIEFFLYPMIKHLDEGMSVR
jgi:hemolysin D